MSILFSSASFQSNYGKIKYVVPIITNASDVIWILLSSAHIR